MPLVCAHPKLKANRSNEHGWKVACFLGDAPDLGRNWFAFVKMDKTWHTSILSNSLDIV